MTDGERDGDFRKTADNGGAAVVTLKHFLSLLARPKTNNPHNSYKVGDFPGSPKVAKTPPRYNPDGGSDGGRFSTLPVTGAR